MFSLLNAGRVTSTNMFVMELWKTDGALCGVAMTDGLSKTAGTHGHTVSDESWGHRQCTCCELDILVHPETL